MLFGCWLDAGRMRIACLTRPMEAKAAKVAHERRVRSDDTNTHEYIRTFAGEHVSANCSHGDLAWAPSQIPVCPREHKTYGNTNASCGRS